MENLGYAPLVLILAIFAQCILGFPSPIDASPIDASPIGVLETASSTNTSILLETTSPKEDSSRHAMIKNDKAPLYFTASFHYTDGSSHTNDPQQLGHQQWVDIPYPDNVDCNEMM